MTWTSQRIRATLSDMRAFGDDFTLVEVKEAAEGLPENLPETVCAFANMPQGGTVLLGVSQRQNFAVTGIAPSQKPAEYRGKAYLRQADGDYRMNSNDHRMIDVEALHDSERVAYDLVSVPGTSIADLDPELLPRYLASIRASSRRLKNATDEDICRLVSVTTPTGELTTAGLYALGTTRRGNCRPSPSPPQSSFPATAAEPVPRTVRTSTVHCLPFWKRSRNGSWRTPERQTSTARTATWSGVPSSRPGQSGS